MGELLSEVQVAQIVEAAGRGQHHDRHCRFDEVEAKSIHSLADALANGGMENFREVLEFGSMLRQVRKAGAVAIVVTLIAAFFTLLGLGIREWFRRGLPLTQEIGGRL